MKKIVIKVPVASDKCRRKALKIAALCQGVRSLALDGESDEVVVTGEEVDAVCLTNQIRKKFRYATLISVENVDNGGDEGGEEEQQEEAMPNEIYIPSCPICTTSLPPSSMYRQVVYYDPYPNNCSIL